MKQYKVIVEKHPDGMDKFPIDAPKRKVIDALG